LSRPHWLGLPGTYEHFSVPHDNFRKFSARGLYCWKKFLTSWSWPGFTDITNNVYRFVRWWRLCVALIMSCIWSPFPQTSNRMILIRSGIMFFILVPLSINKLWSEVWRWRQHELVKLRYPTTIVIKIVLFIYVLCTKYIKWMHYGDVVFDCLSTCLISEVAQRISIKFCIGVCNDIGIISFLSLISPM